MTRYLVQLLFTRGKECFFFFSFLPENYAKEYLLMLVEYKLAGPGKVLVKCNF